MFNPLRPLTHAARVARMIRRVQKSYVGCTVVELMPNGDSVEGVIEEMCWEADYGTEGGWAVYVSYTSEGMANQKSWTSDRVLQLV